MANFRLYLFFICIFLYVLNAGTLITATVQLIKYSRASHVHRYTQPGSVWSLDVAPLQGLGARSTSDVAPELGVVQGPGIHRKVSHWVTNTCVID